MRIRTWLARALRGLLGQNLSVLQRMKSESTRVLSGEGPVEVGNGGDSGCVCTAGCQVSESVRSFSRGSEGF